MAFAANNEQIIPIHQLASATAAKKTLFFKFPRAGTVKAVYMGSSGGVATANTTTSYAPSIMNGGTAGTSTLTVATFGSIATPYVQTARQGYQATFDDTTLKSFGEGQWAVLNEPLAGAPTAETVTVCAHVVLGTGRVS